MSGKTAGFWSIDKIALGNLELDNHRFMETVSDEGNLIKLYLYYNSFQNTLYFFFFIYLNKNKMFFFV